MSDLQFEHGGFEGLGINSGSGIMSILSQSVRASWKLQALRRSTQTLIEPNSSLYKMWFLS